MTEIERIDLEIKKKNERIKAFSKILRYRNILLNICAVLMLASVILFSFGLSSEYFMIANLGVLFFVIILLSYYIYDMKCKRNAKNIDKLNKEIQYLNKLKRMLNKEENNKQNVETDFDCKIENTISDDDPSILFKFKELLDAGLITKEEYDKKKKEILENKYN